MKTWKQIIRNFRDTSNKHSKPNKIIIPVVKQSLKEDIQNANEFFKEARLNTRIIKE